MKQEKDLYPGRKSKLNLISVWFVYDVVIVSPRVETVD